MRQNDIERGQSAIPGLEATELAAMRRLRFVVAALCFLTILLDGYDTSVISFTAPSIAHDWHLSSAAFTPAFVATSVGAVTGYLFCGMLAARFGHRRVVIASVGFFGVMALATVLATSIAGLTALRFVTALGLGGAIPTAIALASEYAEVRRRELTAAIVTVAIIFGSTLGGIVAVPLLRRWGWQAPFVLGAAMPLLLAAALAAWLPDTLSHAFGHRPDAASTRRLRRVLRLADPLITPAIRPRMASPAALFAQGLALPTLLLWAMAFLAFMQSYSFTYWLPLLLTSFGFDRATAALGNTYIGSGGIAGVVLMVLMVSRVGTARYLATAFTIGACFVLVLSYGHLPNRTVPWLLFLIGAGLGAGGVGQATIGAMIYPATARTTGIGWSSAMGRLGSILGPAIAGLFLYLHWPARSIIAAAVVPSLAAAVAAGAIYVLIQRRPARENDHA